MFTRIVSIITMLIGSVVFGIVVSGMQTLVEQINSVRHRAQEKLDGVKAMLRERRVLPEEGAELDAAALPLFFLAAAVEARATYLVRRRRQRPDGSKHRARRGSPGHARPRAPGSRRIVMCF